MGPVGGGTVLGDRGRANPKEDVCLESGDHSLWIFRLGAGYGKVLTDES